MDLDAEVARLIAEGDTRGAATLAIRALGPGVLGYLRPVLRQDDDVADAFAAWSERLWRGLAGFEFRSSLRTWAARLAVNVALGMRGEAFRRRVRRFRTGEASAIAGEVLTSASVRLDRRRAVQRLSEELTAEQQTLLFLRVNQGLPWEEIGEILSAGGEPVDAGAAAKRFERLARRLRRVARQRQLVR